MCPVSFISQSFNTYVMIIALIRFIENRRITALIIQTV